jgi:glycyl-tRNA synthetase beta chain
MDSRVRGNDEERAELAQMAEDAARLCKADLVTGMVGEFPELQGLIGGYYARAEGLPDAVADAIRDHYKPVGQGDDVPTAPVTVAVSLADKLDTIATFFVINEKPTGSKDPFALRRAAIGVLSLIMNSDLRGEITSWLAEARQEALAQGIQDARKQEPDTSSVRATLSYAWAQVFMQDVRDFFADRLKVQQREAGVRHDLIDAVFALGGEDDLVRLLARVKALQAFVGSEDGANLLAGYKRAANILKKEGFDPLAPSIVIPAKAGIHREAGAGGEMDSRFRGNDDGGTGRRNISAADPISLSYTPEQAEADLLAALQAAESAAGDAVAAERFEDAMAALAMLRAPIDAFFESVTVNDADPDKRAARLAMLARIRDACNRVADFSKIEG